MKPGGGDEEEPKKEDSNFISYIGIYTLPQSRADARNIGSFTVSVTYDGRTAQMKGGSVTINAKPPEIDIPIVTPDTPAAPDSTGPDDTTSQGGADTKPNTKLMTQRAAARQMIILPSAYPLPIEWCAGFCPHV